MKMLLVIIGIVVVTGALSLRWPISDEFS